MSPFCPVARRVPLLLAVVASLAFGGSGAQAQAALACEAARTQGGLFGLTLQVLLVQELRLRRIVQDGDLPATAASDIEGVADALRAWREGRSGDRVQIEAALARAGCR